MFSPFTFNVVTAMVGFHDFVMCCWILFATIFFRIFMERFRHEVGPWLPSMPSVSCFGITVDGS